MINVTLNEHFVDLVRVFFQHMGNNTVKKKNEMKISSGHKSSPKVLAAAAMRAWGRGALPINKMDRLGWLSESGFTHICVLRGTISLPGDDGDGEGGELQLWYHERSNGSCIYAGKTARNDKLVCELLMFYSFTSNSV